MLGLQSLLTDGLLQVDNLGQAVDAGHLFNAVLRILQNFPSQRTGAAVIKVGHRLWVVPGIPANAIFCLDALEFDIDDIPFEIHRGQGKVPSEPCQQQRHARARGTFLEKSAVDIWFCVDEGESFRLERRQMPDL